MKKIKILVVEDGQGVLDNLYYIVFQGKYLPFKDTLTNNSILVTYAKTFEEAEAFTAEKFNIVFLDHELPREGKLTPCGYTLINAFRKRDKNTFIVGTTSMDNITAPYDLKFEKSGMDNYEVLCQIVTDVLNRI